MSSISSIYGNSLSLSQVTSASTTSQQGADSDGDNDGSRVGSSAKGGSFASAVIQALSQLGVSAVPLTTSGTSADATASATTNTGSTASAKQDPQQALGVFLHDLFTALHGDQSNSSDPNQTADASGTSGHHHHHGGGLSKIESQLQNLIQQLSSSSNSTNPTGSSTDATGTSNSATATLQSDFQNLLDSVGASGNQTSLSSFLSSIASNLQGSNPGLNVSAKA